MLVVEQLSEVEEEDVFSSPKVKPKRKPRTNSQKSTKSCSKYFVKTAGQVQSSAVEVKAEQAAKEVEKVKEVKVVEVLEEPNKKRKAFLTLSPIKDLDIVADTPALLCPYCQFPFDFVEPQDRQIHVNACLNKQNQFEIDDDFIIPKKKKKSKNNDEDLTLAIKLSKSLPKPKKITKKDIKANILQYQSMMEYSTFHTLKRKRPVVQVPVRQNDIEEIEMGQRIENTLSGGSLFDLSGTLNKKIEKKIDKVGFVAIYASQSTSQSQSRLNLALLNQSYQQAINRQQQLLHEKIQMLQKDHLKALDTLHKIKIAKINCVLNDEGYNDFNFDLQIKEQNREEKQEEECLELKDLLDDTQQASQGFFVENSETKIPQKEKFDNGDFTEDIVVGTTEFNLGRDCNKSIDEKQYLESDHENLKKRDNIFKEDDIDSNIYEDPLSINRIYTQSPSKISPNHQNISIELVEDSYIDVLQQPSPTMTPKKEEILLGLNISPVNSIGFEYDCGGELRYSPLPENNQAPSSFEESPSKVESGTIPLNIQAELTYSPSPKRSQKLSQRSTSSPRNTQQDLCTQPKKLKGEALHKALHAHIKSDHEIYSRILRFEPIELPSMHIRVRERYGVECSIKDLGGFFDAQSVTYIDIEEKKAKRRGWGCGGRRRRKI